MCKFISSYIIIGFLINVEVQGHHPHQLQKLKNIIVTIKLFFRFHVYAVIMEMDSYEGQPVDPRTNKANIVLKRKTFGGIPPGAGMRDDVIQLFQELEEARTTLDQIQKLIGITPEPNVVLGKLVQ